MQIEDVIIIKKMSTNQIKKNVQQDSSEWIKWWGNEFYLCDDEMGGQMG